MLRGYYEESASVEAILRSLGCSLAVLFRANTKINTNRLMQSTAAAAAAEIINSAFADVSIAYTTCLELSYHSSSTTTADNFHN